MDKESPCRRTVEQLCDVLEFQLGNVEGGKACKEMLEHIKRCPTCCAEVDTLTRTIKIFQRIPQHEVPRDVRWRLLTTLHLDAPEKTNSGTDSDE